jgi:hypothetical protein
MTNLSLHEKDQVPDPAYLIAEAVHPRWVDLAIQRDSTLVEQGRMRKFEAKDYDLDNPIDKASWDTLIADHSTALWIEHMYDGKGRQYQVSMWMVPFNLTPHHIQQQNIDSSQKALDRVRAAEAQGVDYTTPEWKAEVAFDLYVNYVVMNDAGMQQHGVTLETALQDTDLATHLRQQYDAMDPITRQMDDLFIDVATDLAHSGQIK